jgi:2-iminobutanoate/2-iminopropanoate deaminase
MFRQICFGKRYGRHLPEKEAFMSKVIHTEKAPAAIGPYSQAIAVSGEFIFVSGQLPVVPEKGEFAGDDIASQTEQSLKNIRSILQAAGADMENVVKTTVLLKDIGDFAAMNEVYAKFFTKDCPARAAFQVAALPKGALVEIEAIAVK